MHQKRSARYFVIAISCTILTPAGIWRQLQGLRGRVTQVISAFDRVVLYLVLVYVFALAERKNINRKMRSTMLPSILSLPVLSLSKGRRAGYVPG